MKKITKKDISDLIADDVDLTKLKTEEVFDKIIEVIVNQVKEGNEVGLVGFGTFRVQQRKERQGRNPQTGESIKIKASRTPAFRAGKGFKEAVK